MKRLTKEQREDVAWWCNLAQDIERDVDGWWYLCRMTERNGDAEDVCRRTQQLAFLSPREPSNGELAWWIDEGPRNPHGNSDRCFAACLIAAMIEAGDLP